MTPARGAPPGAPFLFTRRYCTRVLAGICSQVERFEEKTVDQILSILSMLAGLSAGLAQAFDTPTNCTSLGPQERPTIEIAYRKVDGGIPLSDILQLFKSSDICDASSGLMAPNPELLPDTARTA